jgi:ABC-type nitrate/sulfonate/bicarbonate transport system permease component
MSTTSEAPRTSPDQAKDVSSLSAGVSTAARWVVHNSVLVVFPALLLGAWLGAVRSESISQAFLPSPLTVMRALADWIVGGISNTPYSGRWLGDAIASGERVLLGYAIGSGLGIVIGVMLGYFKPFRRGLEPYIHMLRAIPIIGWLPLSLVFFGFSMKSAVFLVALGCFFPVVINTMSGVLGVDLSHQRVGLMVGASRLQQLRFIIIPSAMPSIMTGLRVAMGFAWILVIVAEWLAVREGLGFTLLDAYSFVRYDFVIAAMISIGFVGFVSDRIVARLLSPLIRWHQDTSIES